jgi:glycosyltransferase involved in cell wall biosynthesis
MIDPVHHNSPTVCMLVTNPGTQDPRVRREASSLSKAGYRVLVVGVRGEADVREESIDGYRLVRIRHPRHAAVVRWCQAVRSRLMAAPRTNQADDPRQSGKRGVLLRCLADLLNIGTVIALNVGMARVAVKLRAEVYHVHDLDTLLAGCLAKAWTRKLLIYDVHELYADQFRPGVKTPLWRLFFHMLERVGARHVTAAITVCDSLRNWLGEHRRLRNVVVVMNVPSYRTPRPAGRRTVKTILYQGLYQRDRGLEQLLESARFLENARIVLRGYGYLEQTLRDYVRQQGLGDRVTFAEPVAMDELVEKAAEADIGIAPFLPVCLNTKLCLPNKLFEYMMAGLPVAASDLPEMRNIIIGQQLGVVFNPEDPRGIARTLNALLRNEEELERMRRNALNAARRRYNWECEEQKLLGLYASIGLGSQSVTERGRSNAVEPASLSMRGALRGIVESPHPGRSAKEEGAG